jgi:hypothetical protein
MFKGAGDHDTAFAYAGQGVDSLSRAPSTEVIEDIAESAGALFRRR